MHVDGLNGQTGRREIPGLPVPHFSLPPPRATWGNAPSHLNCCPSTGSLHAVRTVMALDSGKVASVWDAAAAAAPAVTPLLLALAAPPPPVCPELLWPFARGQSHDHQEAPFLGPQALTAE